MSGGTTSPSSLSGTTGKRADATRSITRSSCPGCDRCCTTGSRGRPAGTAGQGRRSTGTGCTGNTAENLCRTTGITGRRRRTTEQPDDAALCRRGTLQQARRRRAENWCSTRYDDLREISESGCRLPDDHVVDEARRRIGPVRRREREYDPAISFRQEDRVAGTRWCNQQDQQNQQHERGKHEIKESHQQRRPARSRSIEKAAIEKGELKHRMIS
jgi:hypothetical protein